MKRLINDSLQILPVWLLTPPKNKVVWLQPRKSIVVEDYQVSQMATTLSNRKMIRIVNATIPSVEVVVPKIEQKITESDQASSQNLVALKKKKV
jgi:hypothetical protein